MSEREALQVAILVVLVLMLGLFLGSAL